jgi:hypothetical protein
MELSSHYANASMGTADNLYTFAQYALIRAAFCLSLPLIDCARVAANNNGFAQNAPAQSD